MMSRKVKVIATEEELRSVGIDCDSAHLKGMVCEVVGKGHEEPFIVLLDTVLDITWWVYEDMVVDVEG